MLKKIEFKEKFFLITLLVIAFLINFYVGSRGVYPVDTFIHYDFGYRILLGDSPVKDYWIVHGFLVDYIQAFFFKVFGNNWQSYLIHSSLFNSLIVFFTFYIFKLIKIKLHFSVFFSLALAFLAYPVSGTPFLDLHSTYFSLFAIYFIIISLIKNKTFYWFWVSFFLCLAFFSKQVPAAYVIICVSILNFFLFIKEKNIYIIIWYLFGVLLFLSILFILLKFNEISIKDFIVQVFLFPKSIGNDRYTSLNFNFKNIILDFKFIYIFLISIFSLNIFSLIKKEKFYYSKSFDIFLTIIFFSISIIFHQVLTKNQIFIFFLIPILSGFTVYYLEKFNLKYKNIFNIFFLLICLFSTLKYNERFNVERKFHELSHVNLNDSVKVDLFSGKLKGINWISPYFNDPNEELEKISFFYNILKDDNEEKMVITEYNFFSSILDQNLSSPSRTFDDISYPGINTKYFENYQKHLIDNIKKDKIKRIYIYEPIEINEARLSHLVFNYIPKDCFNLKNIDDHTKLLVILDCEKLR